MKKNIILGIIALVLVLGIISFLMFKFVPVVEKQQGSGEQGSAISIKNFNFNPTTVNIGVGQTVVWRNEDSALHNIVSDFGSELSSESLLKGDSYSHAFNTAGTYEYHCAFHGSMKGTIVVK